MKKFGIFLFATLFTICSFAYAANHFSPMTQSDVMNAFKDKTLPTVSFAMLNGKLVPNSFTGYFAADGKATGHFASPPQNNVPQDDEGTWTVKADGSFCATWQHWFNAKEFCTHVYDAKNSFILIDLDGEFTALVMKDQIQSGNQLNLGTDTSNTADSSNTMDNE